MTETNVQQISEELKRAYPKHEISYLSTKQREGRYLIIVKGTDTDGDIDEWSINQVKPILWGMLKILKRHEGAKKYLRLLFVRNNQFVLHSPDIGLGSVFKKMSKLPYLECYGYEEHQYYVGETSEINDVLNYLTTTDIWF